MARRGGDEIADGRPGRPWALPLADRVLLVAVYWRTNLTMRQIGPLLALAPVRKRRIDSVAIVDGTLVPTRDHRLVIATYRQAPTVPAVNAELSTTTS